MGWFNYYGLIAMVVIMVPNILSTVFDKTLFENAFNNKAILIIEQLGRYGSFAFMIFNIPFTYFGFWFSNALTVYLSVGGGLLALYCIGWIIFKKSRSMAKMVWLSITPTVLFLFCGIIISSGLLIISAVLFGVGHITISCKNAVHSNITTRDKIVLELRPITDRDVSLVEGWLNKEHVKQWYEIPSKGVSIADWMYEIKERNGEFKWLTHLIATFGGKPIGMCQYYKCEDSSDEDFGTLSKDGSYGIDYLIGEESYIGKGLGKGIISLLTKKIFSLPDAKRITADIDKENKASERALLSCGFVLCDAESSRYCLEKQ